MANKTQTVIRYLIYLYLLIFPLGKLLKISLLGYSIDIVDFIIFFIAILTLLAGLDTKKIPNWLKAIISFWVWGLFSLFCANYIFSIGWERLSLFYFARLSSYLIFPWAVYISIRKSNKKNIVQIMLLDVVFIAILGWLQYLFYPDLRILKALGWDDHLNRLVSTFMDPAFTGILLVLGLILGNFTLKYKKLKLAFFVLIFTSLLFTYSRASFLSLLVVTVFMLFKRSKIFLFGLLSIFALTVLFLPRPGGSGAELERIHSIILKFQNYEESARLINKSPLIGYGFNNLCFIKENTPASHSCFGLDNSFLFVVTTTGIIGFIFYLELVRQLIISTARSVYGQLFYFSAIGVLFHAFFTNTLFYNFILGWLAILVGISRASIQKK